MKRKTTIEKFMYGIALTLFFVITCMLFYRQAISYNGKYLSDLPEHIGSAMNSKGELYSIEETILYLIMDIFSENTIFIGIWLAFVELLTIPAQYFLLLQLDKIRGIVTSKKQKILYRWISFAYMFIVSVPLPYFYWRIYQGNLAMTCWHNDTFILMRLFALLALGISLELYKDLSKNISIKKWGLFCIILTLTTMAKPSFLMAFVPVLGFALIYKITTRQIDKASLKNIICGGCSLIPSGIIILRQYTMTYNSDDTSSIIFSPFTVMSTVGNLPVEFVLFLIFPVIVLIFNYKDLIKERSFWYIGTWLFWAASIFYVLFLIETGPRASHGNMGWGSILGNFCLHYVNTYLFINNLESFVKEKNSASNNIQNTININKRYYVIFGCIILLYMLYVGISYFANVAAGNSFCI